MQEMNEHYRMEEMRNAPPVLVRYETREHPEYNHTCDDCGRAYGNSPEDYGFNHPDGKGGRHKQCKECHVKNGTTVFGGRKIATER
jgi:hypothetical protein